MFQILIDTPAKHAVDISNILKSHWHLLIFELFGDRIAAWSHQIMGLFHQVLQTGVEHLLILKAS
jgi:hypothetical protein